MYIKLIIYTGQIAILSNYYIHVCDITLSMQQKLLVVLCFIRTLSEDKQFKSKF